MLAGEGGDVELARRRALEREVDRAAVVADVDPRVGGQHASNSVSPETASSSPARTARRAR